MQKKPESRNLKRVASAVSLCSFPMKSGGGNDIPMAHSSSLGSFTCRPLTASSKRTFAVNQLLLPKRPIPKSIDLNSLLFQNSCSSATPISSRNQRMQSQRQQLQHQFYLKSSREVQEKPPEKFGVLSVDLSLLKLPLHTLNSNTHRHLQIFTSRGQKPSLVKNSLATTANMASTERDVARQWDSNSGSQKKSEMKVSIKEEVQVFVARSEHTDSVIEMVPSSINEIEQSQKEQEPEVKRENFRQEGLDKSKIGRKQTFYSLANKKIEINPHDLKLFYDELAAAHFNLLQLQQSNDKFFAELFDDGKFEDWLKVDKFSLCDKELQYVVEAFTLKQQLIEQGSDFSAIDFEVLDDVLHKLAFFERFTKSTRVNILKLATYSMVPAGEYVFYQGDYGDSLYVILRGSVTVKISKVQFGLQNTPFQEFEKGLVVQQVVSSLYDGQHFGELAMMETKQGEEEEVLEERLEDLNIDTLEEARKELFKEDMRKLEAESVGRKNLRVQELQAEGSRGIWQRLLLDPEKLKWLENKPQVREYRMNIVTEDSSPDRVQAVRSQTKSNIQYEKLNKRTQKRTASIQASESLHLLSIGRENFKNILMVLMQDELELKIRILKSLRFFKDVQPFVLIPLANQLLHETKGMDEVIVREGQKLEYMHILYKGSCNVIRTTLTKRTKRPMLESKGAMVGLGDFRTTRVNTPREDQRRFLSHNTYLMKRGEDLIPDLQKLEENEEFQIYEKNYVYRKLYPGDIIFGRALTGKTLEGLDGPDTARMTIISSSNKTQLYSLSPRLLSFCPDFLRGHLLNYLVMMVDVDKIPPQPLNKEIKMLAQKLEKPKNMSEAERKMNHLENTKLREQKKQEAELLKLVNRMKRQKESKQDTRNKEWEQYKAVLAKQVITEQAAIRVLGQYKKY